MRSAQHSPQAINDIDWAALQREGPRGSPEGEGFAFAEMGVAVAGRKLRSLCIFEGSQRGALRFQAGLASPCASGITCKKAQSGSSSSQGGRAAAGGPFSGVMCSSAITKLEIGEYKRLAKLLKMLRT